jgi:hypothetical protein|tara:strand:- start:6999 stop:7388 length:390 start_codon:yes stop_codon:yes gene_type:complete
MEINAPISIGELLDKLSIVEIKISKIEDSEKLVYLKNEFTKLQDLAGDIKKIDKSRFDNFYESLLEVNSKLWNIEDDIRELENSKIFNDDFILLARLVYKTNDLRFEIKTNINKYFGSSIVEQKELKDY